MNKPHHSTGDWDFLKIKDWAADDLWELFTNLFVSPPSCLALTGGAKTEGVYALSNKPLAQNLTAGRITTWSRRQSAIGAYPYVFIGVTGPGDRGIELICPLQTALFMRRRFDWFQGYDPQNEPATIVLTYNWENDAWLPPSADYYAPLSGAVNRVGIGTETGTHWTDTYFDDTEIWLPI